MATVENIGTLRGSIELSDKGFSTTGSKAISTMADMKKAAAGVALGLIGANGLEAALGSIVGVAKDVVKSYDDIEESLSRVQARTGASTDEINELKNGVSALSQKYGRDQGGLAKALDQVTEAGVSVSESLSFLDVVVKGSKINNVEYGKTIDALDSVMDNFNMTADRAPEILDKLTVAAKEAELPFGAFTDMIGGVAPIASEAGLSLDELLGTLSAMTKQGIDAGTAAMGLKMIIGQMVAPSKELAKAMGMDTVKSAGDFTTAFKNIITSTGGSAIAIDAILPGMRTLPGMMKLVADGGNGMASAMDAISQSTGEADRQLKAIEKTAREKRNTLIQILKGVGIEIANVIASPGATLTKPGGVLSGAANNEEGTWENAVRKARAAANKTAQDYSIIIEDLNLKLEAINKKSEKKTLTDAMGRPMLNQAEAHKKLADEAVAIRTEIIKFASERDATAKSVSDKSEKDRQSAVKQEEARLAAEAKIKREKAKEEADKAAKEKKQRDREAEQAERERVERIKSLADVELDVLRNIHETRIRGMEAEVEQLQEKATDEKTRYEESLALLVRVHDKKIEIADAEATYAHEQNDAMWALAQESYKNDKEMLKLKEEEYKATARKIVADWSGRVSKEVDVQAEIKLELNKTMWQRLSDNMTRNFEKWIDDLKSGSTQAWSGVVSDVTDGVTQIGGRYGAMNEKLSNTVKDIGGLINSTLSGNPIKIMFSAMQLLGDVLGDNTREAREAAKAQKEAADSANKAAMAFLKAAGREDISSLSYQQLQDNLDRANTELNDFLKTTTGAAGVEELKVAQSLDRTQALAAIESLKGRAGEKTIFGTPTKDAMEAIFQIAKITRLLDIKTKAEQNQGTIDQLMAVVNETSSQIQGFAFNIDPSTRTNYSSYKSALESKVADGSMTRQEMGRNLLSALEGDMNGMFNGVKRLVFLGALSPDSRQSEIASARQMTQETATDEAPAAQSEGITEFSEGGVVMPRAGGTLGRLAERGVPEAVIPLDDMSFMFDQQPKTMNVKIEASGFNSVNLQMAREIGFVIMDNTETASRARRRY